MNRLEIAYGFLKTGILVFWGVNFIDWLPQNQLNSFDSWETGVQTILSIAGLVFFLFKIPMAIIAWIDDRKGKELSRAIQREELESLKKKIVNNSYG